MTRYKQRLFDLLSKVGKSALDAGEVELEGDNQKMTFTILFNQTWRMELASMIQASGK
jgi:hypothetical protein